MVANGFSDQEIRLYLKRWGTWWARNSEVWTYEHMLSCFASSCWDERVSLPANALLQCALTNDVGASHYRMIATVGVWLAA